MDDNQVTAIIAAILYGTQSKHQTSYERGDEPYSMSMAFEDATAIADNYGLKNRRVPQWSPGDPL